MATFIDKICSAAPAHCTYEHILLVWVTLWVKNLCGFYKLPQLKFSWSTVSYCVTESRQDVKNKLGTYVRILCIYVWVQEYFLPHILSKVQYICTCIYSDFCPLWQSREGMNHHFDTNFMSDYNVHINKSFTIIFYKRYQNLFKHLVGYYLVHSGYVAEDISGTKCLNLFTLKVAIGQPNDLVSHIGKHQ